MEADRPEWARQLRERRREALLSQRDLAAGLVAQADARTRAHLPSRESIVRQIKSWEAGTHYPRDPYRELLRRVLDINLDDLLADDDRNSKDGDDAGIDRLSHIATSRGVPPAPSPAVRLDELKHIAAAVDNARRYADSAVVDYFRRELASCADSDGVHGPKANIPVVLGLAAAIEWMAVETKPAVRHELLRVGSEIAEFAGWLYRDIGSPELANYWRDRAVEWAQVASDFPMQGYVLLKKSQAAWDERDAARMMTLAQATQDGPWRLPLRVQAEAAQQEARARAMLGHDLDLVEPKLDQARHLLDRDTTTTQSGKPELATHYDEALFALQVAICYCEAGQPGHALALYDEWLSTQTFSRRDYGYFLSLKGSTFARANEPDEASRTGREALSLARETSSVRTHQEVVRLVAQLGAWRHREPVRELHDAVLVP